MTRRRKSHSKALAILSCAVALVYAGTAAPLSAEISDGTETTTTSTVPQVITAKDVKVTYKVKTRDKVVFITIDDGFHISPELAKIIRRNKVPITTFAMPRLVAREKKWYLSNENMTFENHTVNHRSLTPMSVAQQKKEICRANAQLKKQLVLNQFSFDHQAATGTNAPRKQLQSAA